MPHYRPMTDLATHDVTNQPPPLVDYNLFSTDRALVDAVRREGNEEAVQKASAYGAVLGTSEILQAGDDANRYPPEFMPFDRYGQRIDEVRFHPSYHQLMALGMAHGQQSVAWTTPSAGHVTHAALEFLLHQVDAGVCCPLSMTYAVVPALRHNPQLAALWEPKLLSGHYDPAFVPVERKTGATMGMAMTEKQGGSDVRANSTRAEPIDGKDGCYELVGHKWFCSAPMSDAFLTLAYAPDGLTCFFVPRWTPDGARNRLFIQRLKDKLGNKANASAEIEYHGAWAQRVGEEGHGVRTIIEMVHHTRLDTTVGAASLMRRALVEALHHATHRRVFQKALIDQPVMQNVLADLAIESQAATLLAMRLARAFDESASDPDAGAFARLAVAVGKYWLNKRVSPLIFEAMEVHGGVGYVEETPMPRLYREAPLNSIWEGSGNVIALDALRTAVKTPDSLVVLMDELDRARGGDKRFDAALDRLGNRLAKGMPEESQARRLVEDMAVLLEGSLMVQFAPAAAADGFCASRLGGDWGQSFGTLPGGLDMAAIIDHAHP
ncbi:acyl-CoA dehydrogenase [Iodidimonas gelatinilytica]|uniref:Acyl-CoA dehydrogenase n=1 Tax=Iodidimonas gelatinilytica TaxID=1236966 RepID=A0A5A7MQR8_9PROT|nr:acyl-CoA dehydrogenase family protein [Iodidimonas gelatinilytica]GEQ97553.1 acyl-CoA dehydrogenase [Iodidimonas gelatinilytica]